MKTWFKGTLALLGIWGWVLPAAWTAVAPGGADTAAIQSIQQASDPSAVVAAYANGVAVAPNDPKLYGAYIDRMVELGLPELAFHQAETLTTLKSDSGVAWGVLAYVNARRGEMPAAVSAINLAGQFAPENKFVQHTAGEIVAWYDLKGDKSTLADSARDGLAKVRALLNTRPWFVEAYDTARKAYQTQANPPQQPGQTAQPAQPQTSQPVYQTAPTAAAAPLNPPPYYSDYYPPPFYYPDYYYAGGPGWIAPSPWWWWQPAGFFVGFSFFPFSTTFVFDHHHHHDGGIHHDGAFVHHNGFNQQVWHRNAQGTATFFGTPARPNAAFAHALDRSFVHNNAINQRVWHHNAQGTTAFFGTPATPNRVVAQSDGVNPASAFATRSARQGGNSVMSRNAPSAMASGMAQSQGTVSWAMRSGSIGTTPRSTPPAMSVGMSRNRVAALSDNGMAMRSGNFGAVPRSSWTPQTSGRAFVAPAPSGNMGGGGGMVSRGFHGGATGGGRHGQGGGHR